MAIDIDIDRLAVGCFKLVCTSTGSKRTSQPPASDTNVLTQLAVVSTVLQLQSQHSLLAT